MPNALIAGRYRLLRQVGTGGMGVVWQARDERLDRVVAIKQLHPQPHLTDAEVELANLRAMREARITGRLAHPYIVPAFDVFEHQGRPCLVLQYLPSEPLTTLIQGLGSLSPREAARIGAQVAAALAAAHRFGVVHRDVKPSNILIADDGTARISDFGIAYALGDLALTDPGFFHGTPAYLAPEVARGEDPGFPADAFGLGATLYAAVEGEPPFGTSPHAMRLVRTVASGQFQPPRRAGMLTPLLLRMLADHPDQRPSMGEVASQLSAAAHLHSSTAVAGADPARFAAATPRADVGPDPSPAETTQKLDRPSRHGARPDPSTGQQAPITPSPWRRTCRALAVTLALVVLMGLGVLADTRLPGRHGTATAGPALPPPPATVGPTTGSRVYTSTTFSVPFQAAAPTWIAAAPATADPNLVTWEASDVAVRFLVPVTVYPPVRANPTATPLDYLAYLRDQADQGVRISDQGQRIVGGRRATILTATADRRLPGAVGCPRRGLPAPRCHGLRPERQLRIAVIALDGSTLLVWLRNDRRTEFSEQTKKFDTLLDSIRSR